MVPKHEILFSLLIPNDNRSLKTCHNFDFGHHK
jgi:hypothetical protein